MHGCTSLVLVQDLGRTIERDLRQAVLTRRGTPSSEWGSSSVRAIKVRRRHHRGGAALPEPQPSAEGTVHLQGQS